MKSICFSFYRGLTLTELLVALVIAAFLLLGTMGITARTIVAYDKQAEVIQMNEIARFTLDYIGRHIRDSGYWGCIKDIDNINSNLNPGGTLVTFDTDIDGQNDMPINMTTTEGVTPTSYGGDTSDIITIHNVDRRGNPIAVTTPAATGTTADPITVTTVQPLRVGNIVLIANCSTGDIAQVTSIDQNSNSISFSATSGGSPGNSIDGLSTTYDDTSYVYPLDTATFSIAGGDDSLGLVETSTQFPNGAELVENVERLNILYGEDTNDDGSPNRYVKANDVSNMDNVVSIRIDIVVVSNNAQMLVTPQPITFNGVTVTPDDRRLRKVYSAIISRRNWI